MTAPGVVTVLAARKRELVAVVVGIALAGVPLAAFKFWFDRHGEQRGQADVGDAAARALALAERRVSHVVDALAELAGRGVDSCKPAHIEALRQVNFATAPIKELSVVDPSGQTLCTDLAIPLGVRKVVSSHLLTPDGDYLIEVLSLGDRRGSMIRIQRVAMANVVAALIPSESFLPLLNHGPQSGRAVAVATSDGTPLAQSSELREDGPSDKDRFAATAASDRYNLAAAATMSRAQVDARYRHLGVFGTMIAGIMGLVIVGLALLLSARRRADPVRAIERALKAGEFIPYFQPIVDIASGKLLGGEVLIRRRKPDGSLVLPGVFIPLLESSGLIREVTRVLMRCVLDEIGDAYAKRPHLRVAFNLAAAHFADETIVRDVSEIFQDSPIHLNQVVLEVTERQPLENLTETRRIIAALQGLGVVIAIDDVGTGHSGLSYLLKLGVDLIKIDKMFIDAIGTDRHSMTIVETLIDLARNMRMDIIAEGVENFEQVVLLRDLGIRAAQGYAFAPPLPASSFLRLIAAIDPLPDEQTAAADTDVVTTDSRSVA